MLIKHRVDPPVLETERLILRLAGNDDIPAVLDYYVENRDFLEPYEPERPRSFYTPLFWEAHIRESEKDARNANALRLFLFDREDHSRIVGYIGYFQIVRRASYSCIVGYSLAEKEQGKGYMTEGLRRSIQFVFDEMGMHRIMANYMPHNTRSGQLLRRLGFKVEGYARDYLLINGRWEDHLLTSLTNPKWQPGE